MHTVVGRGHTALSTVYREVVRSSECPLSEVPLYTHTKYSGTSLIWTPMGQKSAK